MRKMVLLATIAAVVALMLAASPAMAEDNHNGVNEEREETARQQAQEGNHFNPFHEEFENHFCDDCGEFESHFCDDCNDGFSDFDRGVSLRFAQEIG